MTKTIDNELDKKLDEVLDYMGSQYFPAHEYPVSFEPQNIELRREARKQIKQACQDAGWMSSEDKAKVQSLLNALANFANATAQLPKTVSIVPIGYMTDQEFFDRFMDIEIPWYYHNQKTKERFLKQADVQEAAKKAAGLEDKE